MRLTITTATTLVAALGLAITIGACDAGSPDNITGIDPSAPGGVLVSQGPVVTRTIVQANNITHNVCTGEDVHVQGPIYITNRSQSDQAGGFIIGITRNLRDVTATGLTTGHTYQVQGSHTFQAHVKPPFPLTWNEQFRMRLVPPGELPVALLNGWDRFTVDPNGQIRVDVLVFGHYTCPGQ